MSDYDVIVLGGGSAGTSAARAAMEVGARTLMINDGELGGLCILRGCMPTKSMLEAAHRIHDAKELEPFGARLDGQVEIDFARIMQRKDGHVARFKRAKVEGIRRRGIEVLDSRARFALGGGVEADGDLLTAKGYVIATGSVPSSLPIPGIDEVPVWTSDDVMKLTEPPRRLVVLGAGPIGLELAQFFARMGTEVLLVNRSPLLSSQCDPECGEELTAALEDEPNLSLAVPGRIERLHPHEGGGLVAEVRTGPDEISTHRADALLMAVGRRAALDDLGLEHVGLEIVGGVVDHDATMRTNHDDIWVAGDATGNYQILHLANQEAAVAGHNAGGGVERSMDYRLKMSVIFTDPPYAQVGASESEARGAGHDVIVGKARFPETGRAITMESRHGAWKLIADRQSGEILGSALVGPRADDLIHTVAAIMRYRGTVDDLLGLPWYHPTLSEVMIELARDLARQRT